MGGTARTAGFLPSIPFSCSTMLGTASTLGAPCTHRPVRGAFLSLITGTTGDIIGRSQAPPVRPSTERGTSKCSRTSVGKSATRTASSGRSWPDPLMERIDRPGPSTGPWARGGSPDPLLRPPAVHCLFIQRQYRVPQGMSAHFCETEWNENLLLLQNHSSILVRVTWWRSEEAKQPHLPRLFFYWEIF